MYTFLSYNIVTLLYAHGKHLKVIGYNSSLCLPFVAQCNVICEKEANEEYPKRKQGLTTGKRQLSETH